MTTPVLHKLALGPLGTRPAARSFGVVSVPIWSGALAGVGHAPPRVVLKPTSDAAARRARLWELGTNLHCSVIGTCLSSGELRLLLRKFTRVCDAASDHDLHQLAVEAAGQRGPVAKQIQKALDRRHRLPIARFAKATEAESLRRCWDDAVQAGEIPGAYWAALTHPAATDALVRRAFGAVHMLSHLVGAANRADIRRLHQLETDKAALEDKLARLQAQLRDAIVARDARIHELGTALSTEIERRLSHARADDAAAPAPATLDALVADLRKQLDIAIRRRERAERRAQDAGDAHAKGEQARKSMAQELAALQDELAAAETRLSAIATPESDTAPEVDFRGITLLYVGGRPPQVAHMRLLVEQSAGNLIHHDGGIDERTDLLPGLVSRSDAAFMPVDCVSHEAAQSLKRLCRQAGKPFVPLRSSGIASLLHALRSPDLGLAARRPA